MSLAGSSLSLPLPDLIQATAYTGRTCRVVIEPDGENAYRIALAAKRSLVSGRPEAP